MIDPRLQAGQRVDTAIVRDACPAGIIVRVSGDAVRRSENLHDRPRDARFARILPPVPVNVLPYAAADPLDRRLYGERDILEFQGPEARRGTRADGIGFSFLNQRVERGAVPRVAGVLGVCRRRPH